MILVPQSLSSLLPWNTVQEGNQKGARNLDDELSTGLKPYEAGRLCLMKCLRSPVFMGFSINE